MVELATRALAMPEATIHLGGDGGVRRLIGTPYFASVTERAGWAAAVLSQVPVGIDLEETKGAAVAGTAILSGVESVDLTLWQGVAGVWAAREAVLKATGRDLTDDHGGWRFGTASVTATGIPLHTVDLIVLPGIVVAVAHVGGCPLSARTAPAR